jgi:hypothetical protein
MMEDGKGKMEDVVINDSALAIAADTGHVAKARVV